MTLFTQTFPAFRLTDHTGRVWTATDFTGWTVIFAYPKAMTSGCTAEACDFRDHLQELQKSGATVLGLSPDPVDRQKKFAEKEALPYPLLADPARELLTGLGIWVEKSLYGRKYFGVERSTFLLNAAGKVVAEWRKVKVPGHVAAVLAELKKQQAS